VYRVVGMAMTFTALVSAAIAQFVIGAMQLGN
jgi:hypothetical protein